MHPHHPQPQQRPYYQQPQSRGFNPPQAVRSYQEPRPQAPQPQPQPQHPGYGQQYQNHHHQYQQQRAAQYYPEQHPQQYAPQQRYAPQPHSAPHASNQQYFPPPTRTQGYPSYAPSPSYPQPRPGPVVPPVRAHSQSPDKAGRPLPAPAGAAARSRPSSMPPAPAVSLASQAHPPGQPYPPQSTMYTHTRPPASSFSGRPVSQPFSQGQAFQPQPPAQSQPNSPTPPHPHIQHSQSSPVIRTSAITPTSPIESPTSKRPLPAPPGAGTTSPPVSPSRPGAPPASTVGTPPARGRTLPFSPTKPPSVEEGIKSARKAIAPPARSSTLPSSVSPQVPATSGVLSSSVRENVRQKEDGSDKGKLPEQPPPRQSAPFASRPGIPNPPSSSFALPPRQRPTQSLAFRLASLSLREERTQKQSANHQVPARGSTAAPPSRSSARTVLDLDDAPPTSTIRRPSFGSKQVPTLRQPLVPTINVPGENEDGDGDDGSGPSITVSPGPSNSSAAPSISISETPAVSSPSINVVEAPSISVSEPPSITVSEEPSAPTITLSDAMTPTISTSSHSSSIPDIIVADLEGTLETSVVGPTRKRKGLICYGCGNGILGRIVSAMGGRWHPACFKCTVCSELLEHVSSYEHAGKPYCHLDYHEKFAPQCYHCRTPIIDERFITLDDPALGKRTYHEQHFFCAECGDPFLAPKIPGQSKSNDSDSDDTPEVVTQDDDVGFTVYKGHPYCEACHVRLRYPKCKRCKKSIRDGMQAVEALGGKWCWECFLCAGCEKPFDDPAFFQRHNKPYCEACFSVIVKNEI